MQDAEEFIIEEDLKDIKDEGKKRPMVRTAVDLQRLKVEKLMKNPDKPVIIPENPREKDFMLSVPSFVRNVMGSSAGAGSGEFHVYRHLRRKEYARQKYIQAKSIREQLDDGYHNKLELNRLSAEEKTAKKRAKRLKKKKNQRNKKFKSSNKQDDNNSQQSNSSESDDDEENEESSPKSPSNLVIEKSISIPEEEQQECNSTNLPENLETEKPTITPEKKEEQNLQESPEKSISIPEEGQECNSTNLPENLETEKPTITPEKKEENLQESPEKSISISEEGQECNSTNFPENLETDKSTITPEKKEEQNLQESPDLVIEKSLGIPEKNENVKIFTTEDKLIESEGNKLNERRSDPQLLQALPDSLTDCKQPRSQPAP